MGRSGGRGYQLTGRGAMHSPGAPSLRHETERLFWKQIATGITTERAAEAVGVSQAVGSRWFRYRGGMPLFMSKPISVGTCRLPSEKRLHCSPSRASGCAKSPAVSNAAHRPFRGNSRAMPQLVVAASSIVLRSRSGKRNDLPNDQSRRN